MTADEVTKVKLRLIELIDNATDDADEEERLRHILAAALMDSNAKDLIHLAQCFYGLLALNSDRR